MSQNKNSPLSGSGSSGSLPIPSFEVLYTIITALGTSFDAIFNPEDEQEEREVQEVAGLYRACSEQGRQLIVELFA